MPLTLSQPLVPKSRNYFGEMMEGLEKQEDKERLAQALEFVRTGRPVQDNRNRFQKALSKHKGVIDTQEKAMQVLGELQPTLYSSIVKRQGDIETRERKKQEGAQEWLGSLKPEMVRAYEALNAVGGETPDERAARRAELAQQQGMGFDQAYARDLKFHGLSPTLFSDQVNEAKRNGGYHDGPWANQQAAYNTMVEEDKSGSATPKNYMDPETGEVAAFTSHREAMEAGHTQLATAVSANEDGASDLFSKINPKDYTAASIKKFQASGDYADLVVASTGSGDKDVRTLSPEEVVAEGFPTGSVVQEKSNGEFIVKHSPPKAPKTIAEREQEELEAEMAQYRSMHPDLSEKEIFGLVKGHTKIGQDPITRQPVLQSEIRGPGAGMGGPTGESPAPTESAEAAPDVTGGINVAEEYSGPMNVLARWGEYLPGINDIFTGQDEVQARYVMEALNMDIRRIKANNPRFAMGEQDLIGKILAIRGGIFSNLGTVRAQLNALKLDVEYEIYQQQRVANNPNLTPKAVGDARLGIMDAEGLLTKVNQVLDASYTPEQRRLLKAIDEQLAERKGQR